MKQFPLIALLLFANSIFVTAQSQRPNIIFILADDVGYSGLTINGSNSYSTPKLDSMARHGMNFTHCEASPVCSPSRSILLTGKYNFRNYNYWGYMNENEKTFGNLMRDAGYATAFFGKLQLLIHVPDSSLTNWGFDKFTVFEISHTGLVPKRYKSPDLIDSNGYIPDSLVADKYCDDILTQNIFDFIDSCNSKSSPFFIYYSMSLAHYPYCPTPDDSTFANWDPKPQNSNTNYFPSMIKYMDKKVGEILEKLRVTGLDQNTLVIFTGDNGTPSDFIYSTDDGEERGGKGHPYEAGTHVPLIGYWPGHIASGSTNDDLIDFTDFFSTFAEAAQVTDLSNYGITDGLSFYKRLQGINDTAKQQLFTHYDPFPGNYGDTLQRWVRDKTYKLYDTASRKLRLGKFYNIKTDPNEKHPLADSILTPEELAIKQKFRHILDSIGTWPDAPEILNVHTENITDSSAILSGDITSEGGSPLIEAGSNLSKVYPGIYAINQNPIYTNKLADSTAGLGLFSQTRYALAPESKYSYAIYAINHNSGHNTGFSRDSFYTLSKPPLSQPTSFTAKMSDCSTLLLNWDNAIFPASGAGKAGYLLLYSTSDVPALKPGCNGLPPQDAVLKGNIIPLDITNLPNNHPDVIAELYGISKDSDYHFLLVPYTCSKTPGYLTYNYLTAGALTLKVDTIVGGISINQSVTNLSCFNDSSGRISITSASGGVAPYFYNFNSGAYDTIHTFTGLSAGVFTIGVKDINNCSILDTITISEPEKLDISTTIQSLSCQNSNDGIITLAGNGGISPYLYSLNNSAYMPEPVFDSLIAGNYLITVMDKNECVTSTNVTVSQPQKLELYKTVLNASCPDSSNGSILLSGKGGTAPYLYKLGDDFYSTDSMFSSLAAGTYAIAIKDKKGCSILNTAVLSDKSDKCSSSGNGNNGIKISIFPNPGIYEFALAINNPAPNKTIFVTVFNLYGVLVYAANVTHSATLHFGHNFAPGTYIVHIQDNDAIKNIKIVKTK